MPVHVGDEPSPTVSRWSLFPSNLVAESTAYLSRWTFENRESTDEGMDENSVEDGSADGNYDLSDDSRNLMESSYRMASSFMSHLARWGRFVSETATALDDQNEVNVSDENKQPPIEEKTKFCFYETAMETFNNVVEYTVGARKTLKLKVEEETAEFEWSSPNSENDGPSHLGTGDLFEPFSFKSLDVMMGDMGRRASVAVSSVWVAVGGSTNEDSAGAYPKEGMMGTYDDDEGAGGTSETIPVAFNRRTLLGANSMLDPTGAPVVGLITVLLVIVVAAVPIACFSTSPYVWKRLHKNTPKPSRTKRTRGSDDALQSEFIPSSNSDEQCGNLLGPIMPLDQDRLPGEGEVPDLCSDQGDYDALNQKSRKEPKHSDNSYDRFEDESEVAGADGTPRKEKRIRKVRRMISKRVLERAKSKGAGAIDGLRDRIKRRRPSTGEVAVESAKIHSFGLGSGTTATAASSANSFVGAEISSRGVGKSTFSPDTTKTRLSSLFLFQRDDGDEFEDKSRSDFSHDPDEDRGEISDHELFVKSWKRGDINLAAYKALVLPPDCRLVDGVSPAGSVSGNASVATSDGKRRTVQRSNSLASMATVASRHGPAGRLLAAVLRLLSVLLLPFTARYWVACLELSLWLWKAVRARITGIDEDDDDLGHELDPNDPACDCDYDDGDDDLLTYPELPSPTRRGSRSRRSNRLFPALPRQAGDLMAAAAAALSTQSLMSSGETDRAKTKEEFPPSEVTQESSVGGEGVKAPSLVVPEIITSSLEEKETGDLAVAKSEEETMAYAADRYESSADYGRFDDTVGVEGSSLDVRLGLDTSRPVSAANFVPTQPQPKPDLSASKSGNRRSFRSFGKPKRRSMLNNPSSSMPPQTVEATVARPGGNDDRETVSLPEASYAASRSLLESNRSDSEVLAILNATDVNGTDSKFSEATCLPPVQEVAASEKSAEGMSFFDAAGSGEAMNQLVREVPVPDKNGYIVGDEFLPFANNTPLLVFVNSRSGPQQGQILIPQLRRLLNPVQIWDLADGGPETILQSFSVLSRLRILVCGGDGTVSWIISALERMNPDRWPPIAILPLGTGNDLARIHGWGGGYSNESLLQILQQVSEAYVSLLDLWQLTAVESARKCRITKSFTNYIGVGVDAKATLQVHMLRESKPKLFFSRFVNKAWYAAAGAEDWLKASCPGLYKDVSLFADGVEIAIPEDAQAIIFLNIDSYSGGMPLWAHSIRTRKSRERRHSDGDIDMGAFSLQEDLSQETARETVDKASKVTDCSGPSSCQDGLLDVICVRGMFHLGQIRVGLSNGRRLCQCSEAIVRIKKKVAVHADGEPWRQSPCTLRISRKPQQARMLHRAAECGGGIEAEMANLLEWAEERGVIDRAVHDVLMKEYSRRIEMKEKTKNNEKPNLVSSVRRVISTNSIA